MESASHILRMEDFHEGHAFRREGRGILENDFFYGGGRMAHKKSFLTEEGEAVELVCAQDGFERIPCDMAGDIAGPRGG